MSRFEPKPLSVAIGAAILQNQYESDAAKQKALFDNGGKRVTFLEEDVPQSEVVIECSPVPNPADTIRPANPEILPPVTAKSLIKAATDFITAPFK